MLCLFVAKTPAQVPVGSVTRFLVSVPGTEMKDVHEFVRQHGYGTTGVRYTVYKLTENSPAMLCCVQRNLGVEETGKDPVVSRHAINGAQPMSEPHGQGQHIQAGQESHQRDGLGFQPIPVSDLPTEAPGDMYGTPNDGTISDLVNYGGRLSEQRRADG